MMASINATLPIKISVIEELAVVWSLETVQVLREHRVTGVMDGALPEQPNQNRTRGLPMVLGKEAVTLLQDIAVIELVHYPDLNNSPSDKMDILQVAMEKGDFSKQRNRYIEDRKRHMMKHSDKILASAKKKNAKLAKDNPKRIPENKLTIENIISDKVKDLKLPGRGSLVVQIHMEYPFINDLKSVPVRWNYPITEREIMAYLVYRDLWQKGYWVVSGTECSLDFLLYKGDPMMVHACLGVKVVASDIDTNTSDATSIFDKLKLTNNDCKEKSTETPIKTTNNTITKSNDIIKDYACKPDAEKQSYINSNVKHLRVPIIPAEGEAVGGKSIFANPGISIEKMVGLVRMNGIAKRNLLLAYVQRNGTITYHTIKWNGFEFGGVKLPS
uniref:tRNA-intron lyase n=1 Tax=Hirondellea gigas TaxID=1518452 RepID=A0A6A7FY82_9CRUS